MKRVRTTGTRGSVIGPHRSIATVQLTRLGVLFAALLTVAATAVYLLALDRVTSMWTALFQQLAGPLDLGGVAQRVTVIASVLHVSVPYFTVAAGPPSWRLWWVTLIVTLVVLLVSPVIARRNLPLAYALRFAAAIQCTALVYFGVVPARFPYGLPDYVSGLMLVGAAVIGMVPLVLGLTYYVIDVRWWQKIGLTAAIMGHLALFVPLQYALQSYIVARGSLLMMPLAFMMFSMLPEVMIIVALYGWGMSWRPNVARGQRQ